MSKKTMTPRIRLGNNSSREIPDSLVKKVNNSLTAIIKGYSDTKLIYKYKNVLILKLSENHWLESVYSDHYYKLLVLEIHKRSLKNSSFKKKVDKLIKSLSKNNIT